MKVIEHPGQDGKTTTSGRLDTLIHSLKFGKELTLDMEAEQGVVDALGGVLDNRFVLLRDVTLEGLEIPIPLVLVGPPGLRVLYPSASRGVFRAKGDTWEKLDDYSQIFKNVKPNLISRAQLMAKAVSAYLLGRTDALPEVEPALVLTDPGTHVDSVRPLVRIVLADGFERYIASLVQGRQVLDGDGVQKIVNILAKSMGYGNLDDSPYPERDAFSFTDEQEPTSLHLEDRLPRGEKLVAALNKISFSGRQWLLIGFMLVVNIALLIALVILVLLNS